MTNIIHKKNYMSLKTKETNKIHYSLFNNKYLLNCRVLIVYIFIQQMLFNVK